MKRPNGGRGRGRSHDGPVPMRVAIGALADRLGVGRADVVGVVFGRWEEIVGASVAAHVRPQKVDGTTLVVVADHPAWGTQLRHLAPEILGRLTEVCVPGTAPERLEVRVRR